MASRPPGSVPGCEAHKRDGNGCHQCAPSDSQKRGKPSNSLWRLSARLLPEGVRLNDPDVRHQGHGAPNEKSSCPDRSTPHAMSTSARRLGRRQRSGRRRSWSRPDAAKTHRRCWRLAGSARWWTTAAARRRPVRHALWRRLRGAALVPDGYEGGLNGPSVPGAEACSGGILPGIKPAVSLPRWIGARRSSSSNRPTSSSRAPRASRY